MRTVVYPYIRLSQAGLNRSVSWQWQKTMAAEDDEDFEQRLAYTFAQMGGGAEAINYVQLWKWITEQMRADADLDVKGVTEEMQTAATDAFAKHKRYSDDMLGMDEVAKLLRELDLLKYIPKEVPEPEVDPRTTEHGSLTTSRLTDSSLFQSAVAMEAGLTRSGLMVSSRSGIMGSTRTGLVRSGSGLMRSSLFRSAVGMDDGVLRSSCLMKSVVYAESPEDTVLRIREEREELKFLLEQAKDYVIQQTSELEETEEEKAFHAEQSEELSRQISDMRREIEEKDYRIREVLVACEELDAHARQLQIERDEAMVEESQQPEPEGDITASGTFLTKSQGLRRVVEEKAQQAAEAEARAREKERLAIGLATDLDRCKQEVEELLHKNEQEVAERREQNVRLLQYTQ